MATRRFDQPWNPPASGSDATALFVVLIAGPLLLPLIGIHFADMTFGLPALLLALAAVRCGAAARRGGPRARAWLAFTAAAIAGALASLVAVVAAIGNLGNDAAFYLGAAASAGLLAGIALLARQALAHARLERIVDAALVGTVVAATAIYFVIVPGLREGDVVLTLVFAIDVGAVILAALALVGRHGPRQRRIGRSVVACAVCAATGDGVVSAAAAHQVASMSGVTALMWAFAGLAIAIGADHEDGGGEDGAAQDGERWLIARIALPLAAVLAFPALAALVRLAGDLPAWGAVYFGGFFVFALVLVFGRQAYLLADNQRAILRERRLREEAVRRSEELEALTGLATTMTETLEEAPIVERALGVLHLAARATSSALHAYRDGDLELMAATGAWQAEHPWVERGGWNGSELQLESRGGRDIVRLPLDARDNQLGVVTLLRPRSDPFDDQELQLFTLLVDQLAIAVQNARDYRDKLEQAIRDPLTGLYNRRFFYEAFEKEVRRSERYGSTASVVLFDLDDFKTINDSLGHVVGDDALRRIGAIVQDLIRPSDSFARLGGEEFGLLLPETSQLDGLRAAERIRAAIARAKIVADRRVTISGGVSSCPQDATTVEALEKKADDALYWAKRNGKNLCAVAGEVDVAAPEDEHEGMLAHLYALVTTIDAEHLQTRDHSENVSAYAVAIGQALGLDADRIIRLRRAGLLHDVGKIAVSSAILSKPDALTEEEFAEMRLHSRIGATMVLHAGLAEESLWVRHHHERLDGGGYPDGLAGEAIPLEARILFVADAFEAITSDRPYRRGAEVEEALEELERCAGTQFDPRVVDALVGLVARDELAVLSLRN